MFILLGLSLFGFAYGFFHHWRFIKAGGQPRVMIVPPALQTPDMRVAYRGMCRGYGVFVVAGAIMGFIAAVWGPVVI